MSISTNQILNVLHHYDIFPHDEDYPVGDLPGIGETSDSENVYTTSINEVFRSDTDEASLDSGFRNDERLDLWHENLQKIRNNTQYPGLVEHRKRNVEVFEPYVAWYCPVHYFGHGWGIYIREEGLLAQALEIARFVNWAEVHLSPEEICTQLKRSAFYILFLHEQFHHKVESLAFRLLVATGADRYRPYKKNVYTRLFNTKLCLEESLANAESYSRFNENRYKDRIDPEIRKAVRQYLK